MLFEERASVQPSNKDRTGLALSQTSFSKAKDKSVPVERI